MNFALAPAQLIELGALVVIAVTTWIATRRTRRQQPIARRRTGRGLAVLLGAAGLAQLALLVQGTELGFAQPLTTVLYGAGAFAFWTDDDLGFDVFFLWTFAASLVWLLLGFTRTTVESSAVAVDALVQGTLLSVAIYGLLTRERLMRGVHVFRALLTFQVVLGGIGAIDAIWGSNFLFLRELPPEPSFLGRMGAWPVYLAGLEAVYLASFPVGFWIARRSISILLSRGQWMTPVERATRGGGRGRMASSWIE